MKRIAILLNLLLACSANATLIDFESGLDPLFSYSGVSTISNSSFGGINTLATYTGSNNVAFNSASQGQGTFSWAGSGSTFDLNSFVIAGVWGTQTLTIEALLNNAVQATSQLAVDWTTVSVFSPGWTGIDAFRISVGNDFVDTNDDGSGQHWALDNVIVNATSVPEPSSMVLFSLGIVGLFARLRKTK